MHPIILRGLGTARVGGPMILQRSDDDFVAKLLDDLRQPDRVAIDATRAADRNDAGVLQLYQPVHRTVHLALFEAVCAIAGEPRLDPAAIASAGMVIRRVASARGTGPFGEGWLSEGGKPRGWVGFGSRASTQLDPDPDRRRLADQGQPVINARLREVIRGADVAEQVITLHVVAPDVCAAAGRTLLFALIPTVSVELVPPAADAATPYTTDEIADAVPGFLRAGKAASFSEIAGQTWTFESADALTTAAAQDGDTTPADGDSGYRLATKQMFGFVEMLRVLAIQLDAFGEGTGPAALRKKLSAIQLGFAGDVTRPADEFLKDAAEALVLSPGSGLAVTLPLAWPTIDRSVADAIRSTLGTLMQARFASFVPRATRFDDPEGRYQLHGFVRVRRDDGCDPALVWSEPSAPYAIVPWYENGAAPPTLVRLPPLDRKNIRKLKPNVAFVVPKSLFCMLNRNSPKDFLDGKGKECTPSMLQGGIDWICGFNIPIITLCAFIVLFIFLTLFNIIFWWLPFIRICFPLPRGAKELVP